MVTLKNLQDIGCISSAYKEVDYHSRKAISITELNSWSDEKKARFDGVVVANNCLWAATLERIPLINATKVYTSDGESICCWDKSRRILFIKKLVGTKLVTTEQLLLPKYKENKEENEMAGKIDLGNLDNMDLDLGEVGGATPQAVATTDSKESEQSKANRAFMEKMNTQGIVLNNNSIVMRANKQFGRSFGFITRTDKVVRVALTKVIKLDGQGKGILAPDAPEVIKKQYTDYQNGVPGVKKPAAKYFLQEFDFKFRQAKPGKIVGMIIGMPASTAGLDYERIINGSAEVDETKGNDLVIKVLPIEQAYDVILNAFDGHIKESEEILGNRAAFLEVCGKVDYKAQETGSVSVDSIRYSLKLSQKTDTRKTLLTDGNFIPAKTYKTLSQADIKSQADADALNYNVAQMFSGDNSQKLNQLTDAAKAIVNSDGTEAKYFALSSDRASIEPPVSFDDNGKVNDVQIATRAKKVSETTGKVTYPFVYEDSFDVIAAKPSVKAIMTATKLSSDQLKEIVKKLTASTKTSTGTRKRINNLDLDTLRKYSQTKKSDISAIADLLAGGGIQ